MKAMKFGSIGLTDRLCTKFMGHAPLFKKRKMDFTGTRIDGLRIYTMTDYHQKKKKKCYSIF